MLDENAFWKLETLSDRQVIDGLNAVLASNRQSLARLLAHLGEVEERRLHLQAACSSLFSYCVTRLGLSEDEACRRIEVARLARRFPILFPPLATGRLSLSVAALLKPTLSAENAGDLIVAVSGKSVQQARELLAARFPLPDVASSVRKLPEPRRAQPSLALDALDPNAKDSQASAPSSVAVPAGASCRSAGALETPAPVSLVAARPVVQPPAARSPRIEPLSAARYKVQFTAGAELKRKLEMARDLLRHSHPSGSFEPIVERALDLLIAELMKRKFGATARPRSAPASARLERRSKKARSESTGPSPSERVEPSERAAPSERVEPSELAAACPSIGSCDSSIPPPRSSDIARATRRRTLERDGLRCSWTNERGVRCGAQAWLEYDHRIPRGRGGGSELDNLRLLCRAHNQWAAEQAFGRRHVEAAIRARQQRARKPGP